jgi:threonine synthase
MIHKAYGHGFEADEITPLRKVGDMNHLELFHGRTAAFKDMALSFLPHLMKGSEEVLNATEKIMILTATSGDTGKAALEGFAYADGTAIVVFYPKDGVSEVQKRQMTSQKGYNTFVYGVNGNFDDVQTRVKEIFVDEAVRKELKAKGIRLSSANSINIGRLLPQIAYYFQAYRVMVDRGEIKYGQEVNFAVPTGNFGNILAGFYAKQMGLPIGRLICASNENKILYDFFKTGVYDGNREFFKTSSPSMDILVSSNLERLLYEACGRDPLVVSAMMDAFQDKKVFEASEEMKETFETFYGGYCTEAETAETIEKVYKATGEVIDPHTAVARKVADDYQKETKDQRPIVVVSTASPYKFAYSVYTAIFGDTNAHDFELLKRLEQETESPIPYALKDIASAVEIHQKSCEIDEMLDFIYASC